MHNNACVAFKSFSSTINQWLHRVRVLLIDHADEGRIDPSPRFDAIQTAYNHGKLHVIVLILVLNLATVRCNLDTFHPLFNKLSGDFCFEFPDIRMPEEKLTVQI